MVRVCLDDKARHNHPFLVYKDGHVKASRLSANIREHIRDLIATGVPVY